MIEKVLADRVKLLAPTDALQQENALAEALQHFVLASLGRTRFFEDACFHGGTCLRILHGLERFSEDLDFLLKVPSREFRWSPFLEAIVRDSRAFGLHFEVQDRSDEVAAVQKAFLKTDSIGSVLSVDLPFSRQKDRKLKIKLEIDTNPPAGSGFATQYLTFPVTTALTTQTLGSSLALKCHALLCRRYTKGRDWYDFLWYVSRRVDPDLALLGTALAQQGPWAGQKTEVTDTWLVETLRAKILEVDWRVARQDVMRFISAREQPGIDLWGPELFLSSLDRMGRLMSGRPSPDGER